MPILFNACLNDFWLFFRKAFSPSFADDIFFNAFFTFEEFLQQHEGTVKSNNKNNN